MSGIKVNKGKRRRTRAANGSGSLLKRGRNYYARFHVAGKVVERALHTDDEEEARAEMARLAVTYQGKEDRRFIEKIAIARAESLTDISVAMKVVAVPVSQLFTLFRDSATRRPVGVRTLESYHCQVNCFVEWLGKMYPNVTSVRDVSQGMAEEYVKYRLEENSCNTVNKDLNLLAMIWRTLSPQFGLSYNPWTSDKIARKRARPKSRRALTDVECRKILDAAGDKFEGELRLLIMVALFTGLRLGDVLSLGWSDVDLGRAWIEKRETHKTGASVSVPISGELLEGLKERRALGSGDGLLFPRLAAKVTDDGDTYRISNIVVRLMKSVGIETSQSGERRNVPLATFHSLRHTFVTRLIEGGVSPIIVKDAVGHSVMATTEHYTHVGEAALRTALNSGAFLAKNNQEKGGGI